MTPTLAGRWQTRVFLMLVVGALPTAAFMARFGAFASDPSELGFWKLPIILGYVTALGLGWDVVWIWLQTFRWDRDWPLAFQFGSGIWEGLIAYVLFAAGALPGADYAPGDATRFAMHYGTVFLVTYAFLFGPMRVVFPRWRFRGGRIV